MDMKNLIIYGQRYMAVEEQYILDRLNEDSCITVYDSQNGYIDTRVIITRADSEGYVYARILDEEGRGIGEERQVRSGYYISGCEYAELVI